MPLAGFDPADSLVDQLDALAATTVAAVPGFDEFGREAIAVAARIEGPVQPPNTPPVATSMTLTVERDTSLPITLSGTDADGDPLTYQVVDPPTLGTLQGSGAQRTYVPNPGAVGQDAFTFRVNDGKAGSDPATVSITITPPTPVNQPTDRGLADGLPQPGRDLRQPVLRLRPRRPARDLRRRDPADLRHGHGGRPASGPTRPTRGSAARTARSSPPPTAPSPPTRP